jgi:hypothetical protein
MTLESAIESVLAPITENMLDAETVQPLYVNHEEVNIPPSSYMSANVGRDHHRYIICIHRVLFVLFSCLIQILNRNVYTPFVHVNPYTRHDWNIQARVEQKIIINDHSASRKVKFLPRIPLCPSDDDMFPFKMKRKQFPIRLSFAMTINKAQGQTIPHVGVYLPEPVFSHGQLYVALSRGTSRANTKVLVKPVGGIRRNGVYTSNVVYQEVLEG